MPKPAGTPNNPSSRNISYCTYQPIKIREEDGVFHSEGFISTTHPDRYQEGEFVGTVMSKECMVQIRDAINNGTVSNLYPGNPRVVSDSHDWVKRDDPSIEPVGIAVPPVHIRQTDDGHWGVYGKVKHNKDHPDYEKLVSKVQDGYIPGYSIEFIEGDSEPVTIGGRLLKFIKNYKAFLGFALADARMIANPLAAIKGFGYREIEEAKKLEEEVIKVSEEQKEQGEKEDKKEEEVVEEVVPEAPKEEEKKEEVKVEERTMKNIPIKDVVAQLRESSEFKEAMDAIKVDTRVLNTGQNKEASEENDAFKVQIREINKAIKEQNIVSLREVMEPIRDRMMESFDPRVPGVKVAPGTMIQGGNGQIKTRVRGKGLELVGQVKMRATLDSATNTSSYTQAPVEFDDVFAPGLVDTFNNQTNFLGFLKKKQHVEGTHYQWRMITNRDPASTPTFVDFDDTSVIKNESNKYKYQTPLKVARRGVSVADTTLRYSSRSLGDLFQVEVNIQMNEMMTDVNAALFAEVADGTNNAPLGLEAVADSTGNTTIYGYTRSTTNRLSGDSLAHTYTAVGGDLVEATLRSKFTYLENEGSKKQDLAIVCSPEVRDFLFNLQDTNRRFNTIEASFGFNKMKVPQFDGFPIITDHDCNADALYIIDTSVDFLVVGMEPRLINLAKVGAGTEGYLEFHFVHVYEQPRRIYMMDTLTGPTS